jgi:hypothetical protein
MIGYETLGFRLGSLVLGLGPLFYSLNLEPK